VWKGVRVDEQALREELGLADWDAHALAANRELALRWDGGPQGGFVLQDDDGRRFAWLDDPARRHYAPEALTASTALAMGREHRAARRFVVLDRHSGAPQVAIVTWRLRRGATLEPAFGEPRRLHAPLLRRDWRLRDESANTVLRVTSRTKDVRRLRFSGDPYGGLDLVLLLAAAFHVLVADELAYFAHAGAGGGGAG
jgi:hypothetical protein